VPRGARQEVIDKYAPVVAGNKDSRRPRKVLICSIAARSLRWRKKWPPQSTCPKSWRHFFATLLQDANVDPPIRQQVLGHRPTSSTGLGMTTASTHTRPETLRLQVEGALRRWPARGGGESRGDGTQASQRPSGMRSSQT
jgi:integrase